MSIPESRPLKDLEYDLMLVRKMYEYHVSETRHYAQLIEQKKHEIEEKTR